MQHIRPYPVPGRDIVQLVGENWHCPYCHSESPTQNDDDIGWVPIPIESSPQRYMCLGCCEDIHSTCASDDFDSHPYKGIVEEAAKHEGYTVNEFRIICLQHQLRSGRERLQKEQDVARYNDRLKRLELLLEQSKN